MEKISRIFCLAVTTVWVICGLLATSLGPRNALASALDRSGASFLPKRHCRSALRRRESWLPLLVDAGKIDLRFVDRRHGSAIPEGANWKASRATKSLCLFSMIPRVRWPRIRNALLLLTGLLLLLGGALLASVLFPSMLPSLGLRATTALRSGPRLAPRVQAAAKPVRRSIPVNRRPARIEPPKSAPESTETIGYFVNWDEASFSSLKANLDAIDLLVPEWLHVYGPDGSLEEDDAESQLAVLEYLRESRPSLRILPLVNNYHGETFDSQNLVRVLGDKKLHTAAIDRMLKYVKDHAFAGLTIDFEGLPDSSRESFHAFLEELGTRLHAAKLLLAINVQAEQAGIEFTKIAQLCDRVIVMAFDEHWLSSQAGPLASATGSPTSWNNAVKRSLPKSSCGRSAITVTTGSPARKRPASRLTR